MAPPGRAGQGDFEVGADAGLLIVLATSPRVAPGLLAGQAWQALHSAFAVLAPAGHPLLPALDDAGIPYRVAEGEPSAPELAADEAVVWLPEPGDSPPVPPGARLLHGSADLPGARLLDLVATMDRLRVECPWDSRQTHQSLAPHLLEETYEGSRGAQSGDDRAFCEELGDVLLQVVFHARVAAERADGYTIDDVADGIVAKLVRRHPHVFADVTVSGADQVYRNWDEIKREEKRERAERAGVSAAAEARRPRLTVCRSASPPWPWPRSCNAGRRARAYRTRWRASTTVPVRLTPARTSAASCSFWSSRLERRGSTPRWNCEPRRAATAISSGPGSGPDPPNVFSVGSTLVLNGIATGYR